MNLNNINALDEAGFLRCCGAHHWATWINAQRPFASVDCVLRAAAEGEASLTRSDWLEAFAAHPRIGDTDNLRRKFATTAEWNHSEQAGVAGAADDVIQDLADGNRDYEDRFGYLFIVCATGKSAAEMRSILRARLSNDPETELRIAAAEQAKITRLRLEKA